MAAKLTKGGQRVLTSESTTSLLNQTQSSCSPSSPASPPTVPPINHRPHHHFVARKSPLVPTHSGISASTSTIPSFGSQDSLSNSSSSTPFNFSPSSPRFSNSSPSSPHVLLNRSTRHEYTGSVAEKYSILDPYETMTPPGVREDDDVLHNPTSKEVRSRGAIFTARGFSNLGCILLLISTVLALFVGYPLFSFVTKHVDLTPGFGIGGTNGSGQVPDMGNWGLIDRDTPKEFYVKDSYSGAGKMKLVFSDEFNTDGRSFYPGDDPYWEAVDLHYWATGNREWYDPAAVSTANGAMEITISEKDTHDLKYEGGMVSSWNKFCFTGGLIEAAVQLPGASDVSGLWPAVWMMGNLGRAGYGATTDGLWPYSYDACDFGAAPNQTINGEPEAATRDGDEYHNDNLSWLPGQRLSRCTCPGESHPGPAHSDGSYVGRASPEIDLFEAQIEAAGGSISQSAQWAPFNYAYEWPQTADTFHIDDPTISRLNEYIGGGLQQPTSIVSMTNQDCYDFGGTKCFSVYGVEYKAGFDDAYITWLNDNKRAWTIYQGAMAPDPIVQISERPFPQEPMYILMNLGISTGFGYVDWDHLVFPTKMRIDYVRVYQPEDQENIGCDPPAFPTAAYIEAYKDAYTNPNFTTWVDDYKQPWPRNSLVEGGC